MLDGLAKSLDQPPPVLNNNTEAAHHKVHNVQILQHKIVTATVYEQQIAVPYAQRTGLAG